MELVRPTAAHLRDHRAALSAGWSADHPRGAKALPVHCLGHPGCAVVPWKRPQGHATRALGPMLPLAQAQELRFVEVTRNVDNHVSRRVIQADGGRRVEHRVSRCLFRDAHDAPSWGFMPTCTAFGWAMPGVWWRHPLRRRSMRA